MFHNPTLRIAKPPTVIYPNEYLQKILNKWQNQ